MPHFWPQSEKHLRVASKFFSLSFPHLFPSGVRNTRSCGGVVAAGGATSWPLCFAFGFGWAAALRVGLAFDVKVASAAIAPGETKPNVPKGEVPGLGVALALNCFLAHPLGDLLATAVVGTCEGGVNRGCIADFGRLLPGTFEPLDIGIRGGLPRLTVEAAAAAYEANEEGGVVSLVARPETEEVEASTDAMIASPLARLAALGEILVALLRSKCLRIGLTAGDVVVAGGSDGRGLLSMGVYILDGVIDNKSI